MSRYLKKFAGCGARPAIQYVLNEIREALLSTPCVKKPREIYSHGRHDEGGDYAERDDVEKKANEQPSRRAIGTKKKKRNV